MSKQSQKSRLTQAARAKTSLSRRQSGNRRSELFRRRGVITVLSAACLSVFFGFVAYALDSGYIATTHTRMQNAVDAASLAASQEITLAIRAAAEDNVPATITASSAAVSAARDMAELVAASNDVYIDKYEDVDFGKRIYNAGSETWEIQWGVEPYNVVKVSARRTGDDPELPDSKLRLTFGWAVGMTHVPLNASSTAFVEARDIVLVLDFSASMNDDSSLRSRYTLGQSNVEQSLDGMWDALVAAEPRFPNTNRKKFRPNGFGRLNSYYGRYESSSSRSTVLRRLRLNRVNSQGRPRFPFPQPGRLSNGLPANEPSRYQSEALWKDYIGYVQGLSGTYRKRYGYRTLMDYLQERRYKSVWSEDLWRAPHYPFHAVKEGATMFCGFLNDLDFGDELGLVSYGGYSMMELGLNDGAAYVDVTSDPITNNYNAIDTMQRHKQAGHYDGWTGMGYGIRDARYMLLGNSSDPGMPGYLRGGARPTMVIMTDGQTNQGPSGWNLPGNFRWSDWTDYDGNGIANYSTYDRKKQYAFWQATEAIRRGVTIHTMSVGAGADRNLMEAIAFAGNGVWINVPGGTSVQAMEAEILEAFAQIASIIPPPKLIFDE